MFGTYIKFKMVIFFCNEERKPTNCKTENKELKLSSSRKTIENFISQRQDNINTIQFNNHIFYVSRNLYRMNLLLMSR